MEIDKTLKLGKENRERWTEEDVESTGKVRVTKAAEKGGDAEAKSNGESGHPAGSQSFGGEDGVVEGAKAQQGMSSEDVFDGKASDGARNLSHIYPHLDEKPSL